MGTSVKRDQVLTDMKQSLSFSVNGDTRLVLKANTDLMASLQMPKTLSADFPKPRAVPPPMCGYRVATDGERAKAINFITWLESHNPLSEGHYRCS